MWKNKFGRANGASQRVVDGSKMPPKLVAPATALPPATPPPSEASKPPHARDNEDNPNWQLDSTHDNKELTSTRDLDEFVSSIAARPIFLGPVPLASLSESAMPYAKQMEADIESYLQSGNKDMSSKCLVAQDVLRHGIERSPELVDELYLQLLRHLRGSNRTTSVRGWELFLLTACACRPSSRLLEPVINFVYTTSHAKVQWPSTASILAKRAWTALKHNTKPGRRVNVPSVSEIASILSSRTLKVQITFVDGSNKWLTYDWTTTVSGAVEQLAAQIGLKNYQDYTLFEARKVPKKLDRSGSGSVATLPPDSYLLLEDSRRIADVLHDYEVRGAENKLLLKRRRFDDAGSDFSKPQFIALTEAHQAAMDEKSAEVANLTLRMREMSGKVMWLESLQEDHKAQVKQLQQRADKAEARLKQVELEGASLDAAEVMKERDQLQREVKRLEAASAGADTSNPPSIPQFTGYENGDNASDSPPAWKPMALVRKLAEKQVEIKGLQMELASLRPLIPQEDREKAMQRMADKSAMSDTRNEDPEADLAEKDALYDLVRLQADQEGKHAHDIEQKNANIEELTDMVEELASRLRVFQGDLGSDELPQQRPGPSLQGSETRDLSTQEQRHISLTNSKVLETKLSTMQDALDQHAAAKAELECRMKELNQRLQSRERKHKHQEKEWRIQLNTVKAESATIVSRLKSKEAALLQATTDLDTVHKEAGLLRTELEDAHWELENLQTALDNASQERDSALVHAKKLTEGVTADYAVSGEQNRALNRSGREISQLTESLLGITAERDAALDKLSGIQQLMAGMGLGGMPAPSSVHVGPDSSAPVATSKGHSIERAQPVISMPPSARASMERSEPARVVNSSCPLEVGHDPRRESIGGDSAPPHLRGIPPLRVLPEDKKALGTRHPLFAPNYVSPLLAATPERREQKVLKQEAAAMLTAADVKRRLFEQKRRGARQSKEERPAPDVNTSPKMTDRINRGTHLLGLLGSSNNTGSHNSLADRDDIGSARNDDATGTPISDLVRSTSSIISYENSSYKGNTEQQPGLTQSQSPMNSVGMMSTQSESDLLKAYEAVARAEN